MRTPASVVGGYLRMLQSDASEPLGERQRRMVQEAEKSCARLVAIIGELSELGKLDAGTADVKHETFDLFELVRGAVEAVHEPLDREVRLETRGPATGGMVTGDAARVRTAFDVIVRAVMREQPDGTTVVVELQRVENEQGPSALIVVSPSADLRRAAAAPPSPFDDRRGGCGLGLPIARRVIGRLGGQIWSPAPTDGTQLPIGSRGALVVCVALAA
jgi:signal transduction histidine kinase